MLMKGYIFVWKSAFLQDICQSFYGLGWLSSVQFSSAAQSCPTLCNPMNRSTPGLHHQLPEFTQTHVELVIPSNHLILCHPLLLLPSIFPSIRVFSNGSALLIKWPKYWSFSFNISPSNEHPGMISFRKKLIILHNEAVCVVTGAKPAILQSWSWVLHLFIV